MLSEILTLGDKIDIKPLDHNGKPVHNARSFVSQLVDIADYDVIHIATPIVYSKPIILNVGENYNLCFYSGKGLYQCNCVVLNNHRENNTIVAVVRITTNLEKFQRRQYYRLECIHEIEYRVITAEEELIDRKLRLEEFRNAEERSECRKKLIQMESKWLQAAIIDLSGGGARINSEVLHNPGDKIRIKLDLVFGNSLKKMVLNAVVISSGKIINRTGFYEHRVEFNDIMQKEREELIKYIFEQDRRRRRNDKN
jgi:c-di-GMP-binding flagellar brake protein YcgR